MKYMSTLIAVTDMERSKQFYYDALGLEVVDDFGANVTLTGDIALQTLDSWQTFIHKDRNQICLENCAGELYFEEDDIDGFVKKLGSMPEIRYVHPLVEHPWGQRAIRFYDPDGHIIEVGENIAAVAERFMNSGLSVQEIAARMDVPVDYVKSLLA